MNNSTSCLASARQTSGPSKSVLGLGGWENERTVIRKYLSTCTLNRSLKVTTAKTSIVRVVPHITIQSIVAKLYLRQYSYMSNNQGIK